MNLYKYKNGNSENVLDLINDCLWVSKFSMLNDPTEPFVTFRTKDGSFIDRKMKEIIKFYDNYFCCSFSCDENILNMHLWNIYANGLEGFAIEYDSEDVYKSIKQSFDNHEIKRGEVLYSNERIAIDEHTDLDEQFFNLLLFRKGNFWGNEKEYRFVCKGDISLKGLKIFNLKPKAIYIGRRMDDYYKKFILDYADKHNIDVFLVSQGYEFEQEGYCATYIKKNDFSEGDLYEKDYL